MIIGVGTDIIEISRIEKAIKQESFLRRVYTEKERNYYRDKNKKAETLAGLFSAKEAVSKALGTGFRKFGFSDIEVVPNEMGRPEVTLHGNAKALSKSLGITNLQVSISHCQSYAAAFAVAEGGNLHEVINTSTDECR